MDPDRRKGYFGAVLEEPFARLLDIRLKDVSEGYALCEMDYREDMDNLYGMAHGGAIFGLIDEAFEVSSNSHQNMAVALNMNVTYMRPPPKHATLVAESKETHRTKKTASYYITVTNGSDLVAVCQALVYIKNEPVSFLNDESR
ncbi:MAG TPA: PaaI family thioesterase [Syntrophorhabdaceae bacterium]|nr:PaaI family thioesterase [Syntrophorhabdaceae bacterium]